MGLGDKCDLLSQVKVRSSLVVASLDLDEGNVDVLRSEGSLVAENGSVHVKARGALFGIRHGVYSKEERSECMECMNV